MAHSERSRSTVVGVRFVLVILSLILSALVLGGAAVLIYEAHHTSRIYRGVSIMGIDVGGLTREEAWALAHERLNQDKLPLVKLYTNDQERLISPHDLGITLDTEGAVEEAWLLARTGIFRNDLRSQLALIWWGYDIVPAFRMERGAALVLLRELTKETALPVKQAQFLMTEQQAKEAPQSSQEVDVVATRVAIEAAVKSALGTSEWNQESRLQRFARRELATETLTEVVAVSLVSQDYVLPPLDMEAAEQRFSWLAQAPIRLSYTFEEIGADGQPQTYTRRWTLDGALLASWAQVEGSGAAEGGSVQVTLDSDQIAAYVRDLAREIDRDPREGRFIYDPQANTLSVVTPGQNGYLLDTEATQAMIEAACFSTERDLTLPITPSLVQVRRSDLEALMPLALVGEGESSFAGSTAGRFTNIRLSSQQFHGIVIPPQTTFSFLEHLGLVTVAHGYDEAPIIYGDQTLPGAGGGVCQVSTTAFRAGFWGGFPIIERSPHSYRVGWYEPPLGLDAAIFTPTLDIKFRNDTDAPLLMLTEVDEHNSRLFFRLYSKPTGRHVSIQGPVISNVTDPGAPVLQLDPSLAPGTRIQLETAKQGLDVTIQRIIEVNGEVVTRDTIFSRYRAWPARYKVGPDAGPEPPPESEEPPAES